jgi:penicillin amidase
VSPRAGAAALVALALATAASAHAEPAGGGAALLLPETEAIRVAGLAQPVDILIDRYGVPHIYAGNEPDLYFAQGFNIARDRLFQLDTWRRRGRGELAAVFGADYVEQDRAARLFLYRGDITAEWAAYGPGVVAIAERFASGINAYIDFLEQHPERLPPEFRRFNYRPSRWSALDVVRIRSHGLIQNLDAEVARARVVCLSGGLDADRVRAPLSPRWRTRVPEGLDPCLPAGVLRVFELATREFALKAPPAAPATGAALAPPEAYGNGVRQGSNSWAIAPLKSATGRAMLASDPHRDYVQPSIRYFVDLEAPTLHVIGANETHLPGVAIGHNESIAFGLTVFPADQEDLYVYQTRPRDGAAYRYRGRWEQFKVRHEVVEVHGAAPASVELVFTRHGPVIFSEGPGGRAFAVRSAWLEPGTETYLGALGHLHAKSFADFERSIARWGAPTLNHLYADTAGNIGWLAGGFVPRRPNWDGLLPVPGDGRYEWQGRWPLKDLPRSLNPARGYLTSSNELNLPADYPYATVKPGFEWEPAWRHRRIEGALAALQSVTIDDSLRLQNDRASLPAQRILALLPGLAPHDTDARAALGVLRGWDGALDAGSAAAALYEVWLAHHAGRAVKQLVLPPPAAASFDAVDIDVIVDVFERPNFWLKQAARARRDAALADSLAAAYRETAERLGPDPGAWRWGRLHFTLSEHPFSAALDAATRAAWNVGPLPSGGDSYTVSMAWVQERDFRSLGGPSVRVVIDVGDWDRSWAMNFPGQSGDPRDPHYRDLAGPWLRGEYFPLLFSRAAVERATERTLHLLPAG